MQQDNNQYEPLQHSYPYVSGTVEMLDCPMCQEVHENSTNC